ncbi:hypothetical protein ACFORL_10670 [Legionella dresdenensis]|uniref:Interaptin n=1 Tax=Legionella dresdenensis TaxID=450200 RepID=A0ABV8CHQ2_9GAMM
MLNQNSNPWQTLIDKAKDVVKTLREAGAEELAREIEILIIETCETKKLTSTESIKKYQEHYELILRELPEKLRQFYITTQMNAALLPQNELINSVLEMQKQILLSRLTLIRSTLEKLKKNFPISQTAAHVELKCENFKQVINNVSDLFRVTKEMDKFEKNFINSALKLLAPCFADQKPWDSHQIKLKQTLAHPAIADVIKYIEEFESQKSDFVAALQQKHIPLLEELQKVKSSFDLIIPATIPEQAKPEREFNDARQKLADTLSSEPRPQLLQPLEAAAIQFLYQLVLARLKDNPLFTGEYNFLENRSMLTGSDLFDVIKKALIRVESIISNQNQEYRARYSKKLNSSSGKKNRDAIITLLKEIDDNPQKPVSAARIAELDEKLNNSIVEAKKRTATVKKIAEISGPKPSETSINWDAMPDLAQFQTESPFDSNLGHIRQLVDLNREYQKIDQKIIQTIVPDRNQGNRLFGLSSSFSGLPGIKELLSGINRTQSEPHSLTDLPALSSDAERDDIQALRHERAIIAQRITAIQNAVNQPASELQAQLANAQKKLEEAIMSFRRKIGSTRCRVNTANDDRDAAYLNALIITLVNRFAEARTQGFFNPENECLRLFFWQLKLHLPTDAIQENKSESWILETAVKAATLYRTTHGAFLTAEQIAQQNQADAYEKKLMMESLHKLLTDFPIDFYILKNQEIADHDSVIEVFNNLKKTLQGFTARNNTLILQLDNTGIKTTGVLNECKETINRRKEQLKALLKKYNTDRAELLESNANNRYEAIEKLQQKVMAEIKNLAKTQDIEADISSYEQLYLTEKKKMQAVLKAKIRLAEEALAARNHFQDKQNNAPGVSPLAQKPLIDIKQTLNKHICAANNILTSTEPLSSIKESCDMFIQDLNSQVKKVKEFLVTALNIDNNILKPFQDKSTVYTDENRYKQPLITQLAQSQKTLKGLQDQLQMFNHMQKPEHWNSWIDIVVNKHLELDTCRQELRKIDELAGIEQVRIIRSKYQPYLISLTLKNKLVNEYVRILKKYKPEDTIKLPNLGLDIRIQYLNDFESKPGLDKTLNKIDPRLLKLAQACQELNRLNRNFMGYEPNVPAITQQGYLTTLIETVNRHIHNDKMEHWSEGEIGRRPGWLQSLRLLIKPIQQVSHTYARARQIFFPTIGACKTEAMLVKEGNKCYEALKQHLPELADHSAPPAP